MSHRTEASSSVHTIAKIPPSNVSIPLRSLASNTNRNSEHTTGLLDNVDEKRGRRRSSESAGSDFSLWDDTGDLAEQLADEEDPLHEGSRNGDAARARGGRQEKHVRYAQQDHLESKKTSSGIDKEAIEIPEPPPRTISRAEYLLALMMTGNNSSSQIHGLVGKPLL